MKKIISTVLICFVLIGCKSNQISGRSQFMLIPEDMAISESNKAYKAMLTPIKKDGKLNTDPVMLERVKNITERLVAQAVLYRPDSSGWNWSVQVIDQPEVVNAWAMAGGKMAIYSGLITKLPNSERASDDTGFKRGAARAGFGQYTLGGGFHSWLWCKWGRFVVPCRSARRTFARYAFRCAGCAGKL